MKSENVLRIFGSLTGLDEPSALEYRFLCDMAFDNICSRLRDTGTEQDGGRAEFAAAALAYYRFVLLTLTEAGCVTVGEVSVKNPGDRLEHAARLLQEALSDIHDLVEDDGFVFERI